MLRLIIGRAGSGKTERITTEIKEHMDNGEQGLIMIVPEQYSHDAERMLCEMCGDSSSLYAEVLSFSRICTRVFSELGGIADKYIDEAGKVLVMSRALEIAAPRLRVYGSVSHRSEFIDKLLDTAKEFRSCQIKVEDIYNAADSVSSALHDKLNDLAVILDIYWSILQRDLFDTDERLDKLIQLLPKSNISASGNIWIDGFDDFTIQQYSVIEAMLNKGYNITVCITCDGLDSTDTVFSTARKTAVHLCGMAKRLALKYEVEHLQGNMTGRSDDLRYLERNLFEGNLTPFEGKSGAVTAYLCSDAAEECETAAALAIELVKNGARWREIAIAVGDLSAYSGLGESILKKYGIPVYQNTKTDILQMPPALAVSSALKLISSGWDYDSVFTYFKTGFSGLTSDQCDILENYVLLWNIRGTQWHNGEEWTLSQDGYKAPADEKALSEINNIRKIGAEPLIRLQKALKCADTNGEKIIALYGFINDICLFENIEKSALRFEQSGDKRTAECYLLLGEILTNALEQFYNVAGDCTSSAEDFLYQWELLLSKYDIGTIPTSADSVVFGDFTRLKKRGIKHLIILGMTEDCVPRISKSNGIFTDTERDKLLSVHMPLSQSSEDRLFGDLSSVYYAITMPSETLTVSCPVKGADGQTKTPSSIFDSIIKLLDIKVSRPVTAEYKTASLKPCFDFAGLYRNTDETAASAAELFKDTPEFKEFLQKVNEISNISTQKLSPERAKMLYGDKISMTASRVDKYKSCRFSYFLQYGLRAKPRTPAEFDASVIGTFMHYILENVTREVEASGGFANTNDEKCAEITGKYVAAFVETELQGMKDKTSRFKYLFDSLTEDAVSIVLTMAAELRKSDFRPLDFELEFAKGGDLPPYELSDGENTMNVVGIVDRVDGWIHDGRLYLRIVDYKTGHKSFNLSDIWYGMGMQMLIYLFALNEMGRSKYGMEIVPAGVLYAPAREVLLAESRFISDEELEKKRLNALKRSGIILDSDIVINAMEHGSKEFLPVKVAKDGSISGDSLVTAEQLGILGKHINKTILEISREIFSGDISADPYFKNALDNSCVYCDYFSVCHNDGKEGGTRRLTKLKTPEVWEKMRKETGV